MNGADHLFAAILLISLVLGCVRGFIREAIALLSWLVGLWLAWHFAYLLYPWLGGALAEPGIREWTGRAAVLFVVLLIGSAAGSITAHFLRRATGLSYELHAGLDACRTGTRNPCPERVEDEILGSKNDRGRQVGESLGAGILREEKCNIHQTALRMRPPST